MFLTCNDKNIHIIVFNFNKHWKIRKVTDKNSSLATPILRMQKTIFVPY